MFNNDLSARVAVFVTFALSAFAAPRAQAPDAAPVIARFAGTWTEDVSKRDLAPMPQLRFQQNAAGTLEEARGPEVHPTLQPVILDAKPRDLNDGRGGRISWKKIDSKTFERVLSDKDRALSTRRISISSDGKTLTEDFKTHLSDGRTLANLTTYQRMSGGTQGLLGRWKPQSFKTTTPPVVRYEAAGANSLKFSADNGSAWTLMLDGKPVALVGPNAIPGVMVAAKRVDDYTIEFSQGREGVLSDKIVRTVSRDGKTMSSTFTTNRPNASSDSGGTVHIKQ